MPSALSSPESLMTGIQYIITPAVVPRGSKMISERRRGACATLSAWRREKISSRVSMRGAAGATALSPRRRFRR